MYIMKKLFYTLAAVLTVVAVSCKKDKDSSTKPFAPQSLDDLTGTVWATDSPSKMILYFQGRCSSEQEEYPYYLSFYELASNDRIKTQYTCGVRELRDGSVFFNTTKLEMAQRGVVESSMNYEGKLVGERMDIYPSWEAQDAPSFTFQLRKDLDPNTLKYAYVPQAVDLGEMTPAYHSPIHILWASQNLGAVEENGYGMFYSWGELDPKLSYHKDNYMYKGTPEELPADRDVASVRLGDGWRMPTYLEASALFSVFEDETNFSCTFEKRETVNGLKNGWLIKRLTGDQAGNSIFIPMPGYYKGAVHFNDDITGTSAVSTSRTDSDGTFTYRLELANHPGRPEFGTNRISIVNCFDGTPIRPVKDLPTE